MIYAALAACSTLASALGVAALVAAAITEYRALVCGAPASAVIAYALVTATVGEYRARHPPRRR